MTGCPAGNTLSARRRGRDASRFGRNYGPDGRMAADVITLEGYREPARPLLQPVMKAGRRIGPAPRHCKKSGRVLRATWRLCPTRCVVSIRGASYPVTISEPLLRLTEETDTAASPNSERRFYERHHRNRRIPTSCSSSTCRRISAEEARLPFQRAMKSCLSSIAPPARSSTLS